VAFDELINQQQKRRRGQQQQLEQKWPETRADRRDGGCWWSPCCRKVRSLRPFALVASLLFVTGVVGVATLYYQSFTTDEYLYLGAVVSACFSLAILLCYTMSRSVRFQPNPLIASKRWVSRFTCNRRLLIRN